MVIQPGFGWVCDNTMEGITVGLAKLIDKPELVFEKKKDLQTVRLDNKCALQQFFAMLNEES